MLSRIALDPQRDLNRRTAPIPLKSFLGYRSYILSLGLLVLDIVQFTELFYLFYHEWNEKKAADRERQSNVSRVHLEALNLPLGLNAELGPSTGVRVDSWRRNSWDDVIQRIATGWTRAGEQGKNPIVTHDNLWQHTTDPQHDWQ